MSRKPRASRCTTSCRSAADLLDRLEPRTLLDGMPFPDIALLESPSNSVIRIQTTAGCIDIELFHTEVPLNYAAALADMTAGRLDRSFFSRSSTGFLEAGSHGFFTNGTAQLDVTEMTALDFDPFLGPSDPAYTLKVIESEAGRDDDQWTVGYTEYFYKLSGGVASAGELTFNLVDDPAGTGLVGANRASRIIGRIINNGSREILTDIAALGTDNVTNRPPFDTTFDPFEYLLQNVPTTSVVTPGIALPESAVVSIIDIEVIKQTGTTGFFTNRIFYPEGFAGSTINEFLPMVNPNAVAVDFQVIAHFELQNDLEQKDRDVTISTGTIPANSRGGITIFRFSDAVNGLVPQGRPYALEIRSTAPLAANLSHYDFGAATGEAFTDTTSTTWTFTQATRSPGTDFDFLVWFNPGGEDANLTITFFPEGSATTSSINVTTKALRRGGLAFDGLSQIPVGRFAAQIVSDQPIVAGLSHYKNGDAGFTALGDPGTGSRAGSTPIATDKGVGTQVISFLNTGGSTASIDISIQFEGTSRADINVIGAVSVDAGRMARLDLTAIAGVNLNDRFAVRYASTQNVFAEMNHYEHGDDVNSAVAISGATTFHFSEGFMDPGRAGINVFETIGINFFNAASAFDAAVTIRFRYNDGFVLTEDRTITPGETTYVDIHLLASVLSQGTNNGRFFYSIEVSSSLPVVAQMWHFDLTLGSADPSGGFGSNGTIFGTTTRIDA